jgi:hypothetical protein
MDTIVHESLVSNVKDGFLTFILFVNWLYMTVFILSAWLINDVSDAVNPSTKWMNWFNKIPKILRSIIIGIVWAIVFYWGFEYESRIEVMEMVFSMLLGMVLYRIGINKVLKWISINVLKLKV